MYKKIVLSSLVAGALLAMNGCGGGSSSDDIAVEPAVLKGVAVDDLILNGIVKATTSTGNLLDSGRTSDSDGRYTINVNYTGVVLLNVTCDENSTMYNPETNITVACGDDVSLNSLGSVEAGTDLTLNISPLTEIVYQRAEALADGNISNVDLTDVEDARTEIGLMFSVDPLADDPTDGTYADIIGTIHTLADADDATSVIDITNLLAEELADGEADGTADDTLSALVQVMADENITNNLVDTNGTYTPPEDAAALSDIDAAKALFTELRTQAMSIVDYTNSGTPGFLDTEAVSMEVALNDVTMNIGYMGDTINLIAEAIGIAYDINATQSPDIDMTATRTFNVNSTAPGAWNYTITEGSNTWSGTVSFPEVLVGETAEAELYTSGTLTVTVDGTFPLDYVLVTGVTDSQSLDGTFTVAKTTTGADITLSGEVSSNGTTIQLTEANAELAYTEGTADEFGNTEPVLDYFKLHEITMQGIVGGYTIDGSITVNNYVQNTGLADKGGIYEVAESGFSVYFGCTDYSSVNVSGVTFDYDGITYQPSGYSNTNFWFDSIAGDVQYNDILPNLDYTASCVSGQVTSSIYNWNDNYIEIANSGWLPSDITFSGAISRTGASIDGTLNAKWLNAATMDLESDTATLLVNITLSGKLQMPDSPAMLLDLSFVNNETHNTLGAKYTYDATVINMSALMDTDMNNGDIVITTHTGLQVDINLSDDGTVSTSTGTVTKDGALIGTLEERFDVPVIAYVDGSFESLP